MILLKISFFKNFSNRPFFVSAFVIKYEGVNIMLTTKDNIYQWKFIIPFIFVAGVNLL